MLTLAMLQFKRNFLTLTIPTTKIPPHVIEFNHLGKMFLGTTLNLQEKK